MDIAKKLKDIHRDILHNIKWFVRRIMHIARWAWFVRDNYEWDSAYLLYIIEFKLLRMKNYFENDGVALDNKKTAKEIEECLAALKEVQKDDSELCEKEWAQHEKKWGELTMWSCDSDRGKHYRRMHIERDKVKTDKDKMLELKASRKLHKLGAQRRKAAEQKFMNLFLTNYRKWWD